MQDLVTYRSVKEGEREFFYCQLIYDDNGNNLLEVEVKQRIDNIFANIKKCGSLTELIKIGGDKTKAYLNHTCKILLDYFICVQTEFVYFVKEDIETISQNIIQNCNIKKLVENASWQDIEKTAIFLKNTYAQTSFSNI